VHGDRTRTKEYHIRCLFASGFCTSSGLHGGPLATPMKRYVLVDAVAWEKQICTSLFTSDDATVMMRQKDVLSAAMNQRLEVLDSYHSEIRN
jgi:hypothetical protein